MLGKKPWRLSSCYLHYKSMILKVESLKTFGGEAYYPPETVPRIVYGSVVFWGGSLWPSWKARLIFAYTFQSTWLSGKMNHASVFVLKAELTCRSELKMHIWGICIKDSIPTNSGFRCDNSKARFSSRNFKALPQMVSRMATDSWNYPEEAETLRWVLA